jgi:hypothetical protein
MSTSLNLAELRMAINRTVDSVAGALGDDVAIDESMYWKVDSVDEMSTAPTVNVGSLADDVEHVRALNGASRDEPEVPPWHDLDHLIGVLSQLSAAVRR